MKTMGSRRMKSFNTVVRVFGAVFALTLGGAYMALVMKANLADISVTLILLAFGTTMLVSNITEDNENNLR